MRRPRPIAAIQPQHAALMVAAGTHLEGNHMSRTIAALALASAALLAPLAAEAQMPSPEKIHKAWDKNADGVVDKAEWVAAGRKEERFAKVDADGDGKITVEELTTAMSKMKSRRQGDAPAPAPADH
jgi:hypothetical protein